MRKFVNREIGSLRCQVSGLTDNDLRLAGRMQVLIGLKDLDKYLRNSDIDSLKEMSNFYKRFGNIGGISLEAVPSLITIIVSIILATRINLSKKEIKMLNAIMHVKDVRTISKYFGFKFDCDKCKKAILGKKEINLENSTSRNF